MRNVGKLVKNDSGKIVACDDESGKVYDSAEIDSAAPLLTHMCVENNYGIRWRERTKKLAL